MLPSRHRLPLRSLPDYFDQADRIHGKVLSLYYLVNDGTDADQQSTSPPARAAVIVPKSAVNKAADRSQLKRRLRSIVLEAIRQQQVPSGWDVVVVAHQLATFQDLESQLATLIKRAHQTGSKK